MSKEIVEKTTKKNINPKKEDSIVWITSKPSDGVYSIMLYNKSDLEKVEDLKRSFINNKGGIEKLEKHTIKEYVPYTTVHDRILSIPTTEETFRYGNTRYFQSKNSSILDIFLEMKY